MGAEGVNCRKWRFPAWAVEKPAFASLELEVPPMRLRKKLFLQVIVPAQYLDRVDYDSSAWLFLQMDGDSSGELSFDEVSGAVAQIWPQISPSETTRAFKIADGSGPAGAAKHSLAFPTVNQVCVAVLYGRAGGLMAENGGSRPGQRTGAG
jgi:hypothetical protein